jgi:hypothetical protein
MTKEELEKEAEENSFRYTLDKPWVCEVERKQIMAHFEKGYLAGAESREKRIEELEKENAELRKKCLSAQDAVTMQMYTNKANKEIADKKLAKAKELLAKWVELYKPKIEDFPKPPIQVDTEQFLSEVEK